MRVCGHVSACAGSQLLLLTTFCHGMDWFAGAGGGEAVCVPGKGGGGGNGGSGARRQNAVSELRA